MHERLHKSETLRTVAFGRYLEELCDNLKSAMSGSHVKLIGRAAAVSLPAEIALPLALIATELVANAFKHGAAAVRRMCQPRCSATRHT